MIPGLRSPARIPVGTTGQWPLRRKLSFSHQEIQNHIWCTGASGFGKSRWLTSLMLSLHQAGLSFTLLDPHEDLAKLTLYHLIEQGAFDQPGAFDRILYLDIDGAARQQRFFPMNVLNQPHPERRLSKQIHEALKRAWPELRKGSANFDNLVLASLPVLIQNNLPLPAMHYLLTNKPWRDQLLDKVDDPEIISLFQDRFDRWGKEQPLLIESTLRRTFLLSYSPELKYSLAQTGNILNYRQFLEQQKTVIINLGGLHEDDTELLGCLIMLQIESATFARAELEPWERGDGHTVIMDEAPSFLNKSARSVEKSLSQLRKYGGRLVMAHQGYDQVRDILGALQNAEIMLAFRLGVFDALQAAPIYGTFNPHKIKHQVDDPVALDRTHPAYYSLSEQDRLTASFVANMPKRHALLRKPDGNVMYLRSLDVPDVRINPDRLAAVQDHYLKRYFRHQSDIERDISSMRPPAEPEPALRRVHDLRAERS